MAFAKLVDWYVRRLGIRSAIGVPLGAVGSLVTLVGAVPLWIAIRYASTPLATRGDTDVELMGAPIAVVSSLVGACLIFCALRLDGRRVWRKLVAFAVGATVVSAFVTLIGLSQQTPID